MTAQVVSTAAQGSDEWLEGRRAGIGGSDVGAVLGLSPWATPLSVWLSKQPGYDGGPPSEPMQWGHRLEPLVRDHYASQRPGVFVEEVPGILAHPTRPWMRASLDGLAHSREGTRLLEVKTSRHGFDTVPDAYMAQVQWMLAICSLEAADVACLFSGNRYVEFEVESDLVLQREMADYCGDWWHRYVVSGTVPPADPVRDAPILSRVWTPDPGGSVEVDADLAVRLREAKARAAEADAEYKRLAAEVQSVMAEASTATVGDVRVASWTATKPRRFVDTARLKADGIYDSYTREGEATRTFRLDSKWLKDA